MENETMVCANPECHCPAPMGSDYCSDYCQDPSFGDQSDYDQPLETGKKMICLCGHGKCAEADRG